MLIFAYTFRKCDKLDCNKDSGSSYRILQGCGHSLHVDCLPYQLHTCSICKEGLSVALKSLSDVAGEALALTLDNGKDGFVGDCEQGETDEEIQDEEDSITADPTAVLYEEPLMRLRRKIFSWGLVPGPLT